MAFTGVSGLRYAKLTTDTAGACVYGTPVLLPGAAAVERKTGKDIATDYGDNGPKYVASALGEISLDIELTELAPEAEADLLGRSIVAGEIVGNGNDVAPYVAIGFVGQKANGKNMWVWLLKGQFSEFDTTLKTKTDKVEFGNHKLSAKFVTRDHDNEWIRTKHEDALTYVEGAGATFIATVPA